MELGKEMPSGGSALKALDPRSEEGLPLLATLVGVFAALVFVVLLYNSLATIINWNPIFWLLGKLPAFFSRVFMAIVMIISAVGGLVFALSFVKLLHLLHGWRHQADSGSATPSTPEA